MRQLYKILLAASVLTFAATMSAGSCDIKLPSAGGTNTNTNANDGGGNGGTGNGGNGGGGTPDPNIGPGSIKINITDANLAKLSGDTILLKLSAWSTAGNLTSIARFREVVNTADVNERKKAFEIVNDKAKEGMVLVGKGNVANAGAITTLAVGAFAGTDADDDGIHIVPRATANAGYALGLNVFSVFANDTFPANTAEADADSEPFGFSISLDFMLVRSARDHQPIFYCRTAVPAITAAVAATDKLTGGHKADCYISSRGGAFAGMRGAEAQVRADWLAAAQPFKREIQVAVSAIKTDGKTIGDLMPGANAAARVAAFNDGINATEMAGLLTASGHGTPPFKKFNIKIVNDMDFANAP